MCQIYHNWIHHLYCSPLSYPTPNSWNSFNRYHFSIYIHVYILIALYSSYYPFPHQLPPPTWATPPHRTSSALLQLCRRKNIKDKKRNTMFVLVFDKESYTGSFFVSFPCIHVRQLQLIHLFQSSLLLPSPLPMVAPAI
jgi:hypothetical protein